MKMNVIMGLFCYLLAGCAVQKTSDKEYYENLSALRPKVIVPTDTPYKETSHTREVKSTIEPTKTVNNKVDVVLDSIDQYNLVRKFVDGYTIQIYSGQNREEAMDSKKKMSIDLPDMTANLQYQQPKFRVTVGRYYTKLEANEDLVRLRTSFAAAILVPEKIQIK
jgi:hypothetical protein